ncbi:MAG TPA: alpha/beta hydrolase fold domain-containing protein [Nevskiales bacterium]|nr:alpha/beta hydrolase fold domain-containing protein [Nevskiales bacterium]
MNYQIKPIKISARSRFWVGVLRVVLKTLIRLFALTSVQRVVREHVRLAGQPPRAGGLPLEYRIVNRVPGPALGDWRRTDGNAVLYLHGGGFLIPAVPSVHLPFMAALCKDLDAIGFMPDYRLAPFHKYPAALDDCERAYRGLLELGFAPNRILVAGESAGGNLTLGLLLRLKRLGLPLPACAVPISPVTEMARVHAPPARVRNIRRDPMIPLHTMGRMLQLYAADLDGSDPELSPLYGDYAGLPPLYFLVGETEVLLDDTLLAAKQARAAGVDVQVDVWPLLPHAFPLFKRMFPEVTQARRDIVAFARQHLK